MRKMAVLFLGALLAIAVEPSAVAQELGSSCSCPKAGVWRLVNLKGWMECNVPGMKRRMSAEQKNKAALWILDDQCSSIFFEASEKKREDVLMDRGRDCLFFGVVMGEEDGAEALFDGALELESDDRMTGEFFLEMSAGAFECKGHRPFRAEFVEPLREKDIPKLEKKMQKKLETARESLVKERERFEEYLKETDGGKALGGRNGDE